MSGLCIFWYAFLWDWPFSWHWEWLLLGLLVPYLLHYYFLENTTQRIYLLYNRLSALEDGIEYPNTDPDGKI